MPQRDIEKLLGGYATDTLTEEERKELFAAALRDQTLFNALADEHALKEVLDDPRARRLLIDALKKKTAQRYWLENFLTWLQRPSSWALAGSVAVALLAITFVIRISGQLPQPPMTADSKAPAASSPAPPSVPKATDLPSQIQSETRPAQDELSDKKGNRDTLSTKQAQSPVSPQASVLKTPSASLDKEEESTSRRSQSVVPEAPGSAPAGPPRKEQQELHTGEEHPAPEPPKRESFSGYSGQSKKSRAVETTEGTLQAQAPERQAGGKAREDTKALFPLARATKPQDLTSKVEPLSIRYTVMRRQPDGNYLGVDPTTIFHTGDQVRLAIEPDDSGYLYVLSRDAAGHSKMVFPSGDSTEAAYVEKTVRYLVPSTGAFIFDEPGDQRVAFLFAREPLTEFRSLLESADPAEKKAQPDVGAGVAGKETERGTAKDTNLLTQSNSSSFVRIEITLKHQ